MMRGPNATEAVAARLAVIDQAGREDLLALWTDLIGGVAPKSISRPVLRRILAYECQARQAGGLTKARQRQISAVAEGRRRSRASTLSHGGRLIREWAGVSHVVDVTGDGYRWKGKSYRSLSAIAREITGAHWSGPRFFGLDGAAPPKARPAK